jgi:hypothetical protein
MTRVTDDERRYIRDSDIPISHVHGFSDTLLPLICWWFLMSVLGTWFLCRSQCVYLCWGVACWILFAQDREELETGHSKKMNWGQEEEEEARGIE